MDLFTDLCGKMRLIPSMYNTRTFYIFYLLNQNISDTCGKTYMGVGFVYNGLSVSRGAFPWLAGIIWSKAYMCGGTLVSRNKVITSAHCIQDKHESNKKLQREITVLLGVHDLDNKYEIGRVVVAVKSIHINPEWDIKSESYDADMAILELENEVRFNRFIQPICMIDPNSDIPNHEGIFVGFGKSEDESKVHENTPKMANIPIHHNDDCTLNNYRFKQLSSHRTFCGGHANGTSICVGDSGSGLFVKKDNIFYLRGIASASLINHQLECDIYNYGVFIDVTKFEDWLSEMDLVSLEDDEKNDLSDFNTDDDVLINNDGIVNTICNQELILYRNQMSRKAEKCSISGSVPFDENLNKLNQQCGKSVIGHGMIKKGTEMKHGSFPWISMLVTTSGLFFCGGTLISNKVVVTAAHCILYDVTKPQLLPRQFSVVLGAHNFSAKFEHGKVLVAVNKTRLHPDWNPNTASFDADIAVLELDERITFSKYIQPICLISPGSNLLNIKHSIVAGFGRNDLDEIGIASVMTSPIIYTRACVKVDRNLESLLSPRMFCGGYANGTGSCDGDSGSGLFVEFNGRFYLRGIVSSAIYNRIRQCNVNTHSVFSDATWFYDWINNGSDNDA